MRSLTNRRTNRRTNRCSGGLWADTRAATAVEFAFIMPVLVIVLMLAIEAGRAAWVQTTLEFAVQEASRFAAANPDATATAIRSRALSKTPGLDGAETTVTVTRTSGPSPEVFFLEVTASHPFRFLVPLVETVTDRDGIITLSASSRMPVLN